MNITDILEHSEYLISTFSIAISLFIIVQFTKRLLSKFIVKNEIDPNRKKIILYFIYWIWYTLAGIGLVLIWGIEFHEFSGFISSIFAVFGIGFIAQWSILSNLTSSVILFFSHPMRIGDRICVVDKDHDWSGEVQDISGFFIRIKTDNGKDLVLPNSLILQKGIELLGNNIIEEKN